MRSCTKPLPSNGGLFPLLFSLTLGAVAPLLHAQGPSPENGATLFPGGAVVSYNSVFAARKQVRSPDINLFSSSIRPTLEHRGNVIFGWGFRRDFQFTAIIPIVTHHLDLQSSDTNTSARGSGLGDIRLLLKYRFLRRDSKRGTTQASLTVGPKLATGRTGLRDRVGALLPASLQPGSGSTDLFLSASGTYTGLFHVKRLVADGTVSYLLRTEGTQQTRLGDFLEARFWLSYRPYQTREVAREWFVGPSLTWAHSERDRRAGIRQARGGGDVLFLGLTNYVSPHAGWMVWVSLDIPVTQNTNGMPLENKRQISFGVTKQLALHR